jgi:hypothetical protein
MWIAARVVGGTSASTDTGVDECAGDGPIDPSELGGGGISPTKVDEYSSSSSPAGWHAELSRTMDKDYRIIRMDNEEEGDIMGLLLRRTRVTRTLHHRRERVGVKARAVQCRWIVSLTRRRSSGLLLV